MKYFGGFFCFLILFSFSCDLKTSDQSLPESVGKYGNVLLVIDSSLENASVGHLIDSLLTEDVYGLPQAEPLFSLNTVPPNGFKDILKRASNIIRIMISPNESPGINVRNNIWAMNQVVIDVNARNKMELELVFTSKGNEIVDLLNNQEFVRLKKQFMISPNDQLSQEIADTHNIEMDIPDGFYLMDSKEYSFWIKREKSIGEHQVIQAMMVYYYPYVSEKAFGVDEMLAKRNDYTRGYIKGMTDSSYMKVYQEYPVSSDTMNVGGMYAVQFKGLWNMENDFMGGPFVHYTVLDEKNNRIINLDVFVYAPKFNKREYLRELQAIVQTIEIAS